MSGSPIDGMSPSLSKDIQQLEQAAKSLDDARSGKVHEVFGKTLSGAKALEKKEYSLASKVLKQAEQEKNTAAVRKVSDIVGKELHRVADKADPKKHLEQKTTLGTILENSDRYFTSSDQVTKVSLSQIKGKDGKEVSDLEFLQKAFSEPNYVIKVPYKGEEIEVTGLGLGKDGKIKGAGAYGRVFFGEHKGKKLAFKLQHISTQSNVSTYHEVAQSIKLNGKPHLLGTEHAINIDDDYIITVMENAEGGELLDKLSESESAKSLKKKEKIFPQKDRIRIVREVAIGVREMHKMGLAHLDIKLENVLLQKDEKGVLRAKVADFGLSSYEGSVTGVRGTPGYYAPEMLDEESTINGSSDVFSLGMMLHEVMTGGQPVIVGKSGGFPSNQEYKESLLSNKKYSVDSNLFRNGLIGWADTSEGLARLVGYSICSDPKERVSIDLFINELDELESKCN